MGPHVIYYWLVLDRPQEGYFWPARQPLFNFDFHLWAVYQLPTMRAERSSTAISFFLPSDEETRNRSKIIEFPERDLPTSYAS
jgi:hypothetical protein